MWRKENEEKRWRLETHDPREASIRDSRVASLLMEIGKGGNSTKNTTLST